MHKTHFTRSYLIHFPCLFVNNKKFEFTSFERPHTSNAGKHHHVVSLLIFFKHDSLRLLDTFLHTQYSWNFQSFLPHPVRMSIKNAENAKIYSTIIWRGASCKYSRLVYEIFGWMESNEISFLPPLKRENLHVYTKLSFLSHGLVLHSQNYEGNFSLNVRWEHTSRKRLPRASHTQKSIKEKNLRL